MSELILSNLVLNVQNPNYSSAANPLRELVEESSETNTERIKRPVYIVTKSLDSCIKHLERMFKVSEPLGPVLPPYARLSATFQHWGVSVGDYVHEIGADGKQGDMVYFITKWDQLPKTSLVGFSTLTDGEIQTIARKILESTHGSYHYIYSNCQHFSSALAELIITQPGETLPFFVRWSAAISAAIEGKEGRQKRNTLNTNLSNVRRKFLAGEDVTEEELHSTWLWSWRQRLSAKLEGRGTIILMFRR